MLYDLQFKVKSEQQTFKKALYDNVYLLSEFLPEICREEIAEEIFFHISSVLEMSDLVF